MIRRLGKLSSAVVLSFLCLALFSTGVFAQSASHDTAQSAVQRSTTHAWQTVNVVAGNQNGTWRGGWGGFGRAERGIRVTRSIRVTQIIRVTRVKIIRVTRTLRVTRWLRQTHARRFACGWDC
jgi:hypothetical protein